MTSAMLIALTLHHAVQTTSIEPIRFQDGKIITESCVSIRKVFDFIGAHASSQGEDEWTLTPAKRESGEYRLGEFPDGVIRFSRTSYDPKELISVLDEAYGAFHLFTSPVNGKKVFVVYTGSLAPGYFRIDKIGHGVYRLTANAAKAVKVVDGLNEVFGLEPFAGHKPEEQKIIETDRAITCTLDDLTGEELRNKVVSAVKKAAPTPDVIRSWPLCFTATSSLLTSTGTIGAVPASSDTGTNLAKGLNAVYGEKAVTAVGGALFIKSDADTNFSIREALAKWIDIPYDQVKLDAWVFQANEGKKDEESLADRVSLLRQGVRVSKGLEHALTADLEASLQQTPLDVKDHEERIVKLANLCIDFHLIEGRKAPFTKVNEANDALDACRKRFRPLVEYSLFVPFLKQDKLADNFKLALSGKGKRAETFYKELNEGLDTAIKSKDARTASVANDIQDLVKRLQEQRSSVVVTSLTKAQDTSADVEAEAVLNYLEHYKRCSLKETEARVEPEQLVTDANMVDILISRMLETVAQSLSDSTAVPLQEWVADRVSKGPKGRKVLVFSGKTSISVTSSRYAGVDVHSDSNMPYTGPTTGSNLLPNFASALTGVSLTSAEGALALGKALEALNPTQTTFTKLESGLTLAVRPTVLPGARSARLQIDMLNSVDPTKASGNWVATEGRPDVIKTERLTTDVQVNAFDLFELNTIALENVGPGDYRWQIPVLDGLPLLGGMFRGPRSTEARVHKAVVIVHTSVIPRANQVSRMYRPD